MFILVPIEYLHVGIKTLFFLILHFGKYKYSFFKMYYWTEPIMLNVYIKAAIV